MSVEKESSGPKWKPMGGVNWGSKYRLKKKLKSFAGSLFLPKKKKGGIHPTVVPFGETRISFMIEFIVYLACTRWYSSWCEIPTLARPDMEYRRDCAAAAQWPLGKGAYRLFVHRGSLHLAARLMLVGD